MLKDILNNYDDMDKTMFNRELDGLKEDILKKFQDFDVNKNESLIKDFLILRKAIVSKRYATTEETEMIRVFDNSHSKIIDDEQVNKVLRFITERTATPES